jgi:farnesyl-diphosphate farnesyltransferase
MDFTQQFVVAGQTVQFVVAGQTVTGRTVCRGLTNCWANGLPDQEHLDAYCYHVAGVVGEMLTELFCIHSQTVARHREDLSRLAVSFGEGLQLTNILADVWEDKRRNACWLPQSVFTRHGFDLKDLSVDCHGQAFQDGLADLIAVARRHLGNALTYTLTIPKSEPGIRAFCLLAIGMAVLTLRRIDKHRDFTSRAQVKISRRAVYATVLAARLAGRSNLLLKAIFAACAPVLRIDIRAT